MRGRPAWSAAVALAVVVSSSPSPVRAQKVVTEPHRSWISLPTTAAVVLGLGGVTLLASALPALRPTVTSLRLQCVRISNATVASPRRGLRPPAW